MSALQPPAPYLGKGHSFNKQPFVLWVHRFGHTVAYWCEPEREIGIRITARAFAEVRPGVFCWLCGACADELEGSR